jgi:arylsulfatase A-like enzyme
MSSWQTPSARPHILLMLADDWGSYDAGFRQRSLGRVPDVATPAIDALGAEGIFLSSYYVQPICTPTRASLLTGRFSSHTGSEHQLFGTSEPSCLPLDMPLLPQCLAVLGYQAHMVGKWHLGYPKASCAPWRRGFETYLGYLNGNEGYYAHGLAFATDFHFCRSSAGRSRNASSAPEESSGACDARVCHSRYGTYEGTYSTHVYTSRVQDLLDSWASALGRCGREDERLRADSGVPAGATAATIHRYAVNMAPGPAANSSASAEFLPSDARCVEATRPLFIYVAWQAVHEPLEEPPPLSALRLAALPSASAAADPSRRLYARMLASMDEGIENITATLRRNSMYNNTVIVSCRGCSAGAGGANSTPHACTFPPHLTPLHFFAPSHPSRVHFNCQARRMKRRASARGVDGAPSLVNSE